MSSIVIVPNILTIGSYVPYSDSLVETFLEAIDRGLYACWFDLGNARNHTRMRIDDEDIEMSKLILQRFPISVFTRIPSNYNLCGSRSVLAWNGNSSEDTKIAKRINEIEYELTCISNTLDGYVIMEAGSHVNREAGLCATATTINSIEFSGNTQLLIVNSVDEYNNICTSIDNLVQVLELVKPELKRHVGLCIDLVALFVNGYPINTHIDFLDILQRCYITPTSIFIGDTTTQTGSKQINRCPIGSGMMWKNIETLYSILSVAVQRNIVLLTHTHKDTTILKALSMTTN